MIKSRDSAFENKHEPDTVDASIILRVDSRGRKAFGKADITLLSRAINSRSRRRGVACVRKLRSKNFNNEKKIHKKRR